MVRGMGLTNIIRICALFFFGLCIVLHLHADTCKEDEIPSKGLQLNATIVSVRYTIGV